MPGDDFKTKASDLVREVSAQEGDHVSDAFRGSLIDAVEHDLRARSVEAAMTEERLAKVETQTRVLSDAVVAINETISETPDTLGPAVQAVKDEM
jgi:hypothetical protein